MKHENTVPYGVVAPDPKYWVIAPLMAGGHCSTKIYMAASNKDCAAPTNIIFGSALMTLTASAIVGLDVPLAFPAEFSFHKKAAKIAPIAKKPVDNSKGPVGPLLAAAKEAN